MGLLSLSVFGVTLEALNDPKELSAIPFKPWDFLTYGLIALGIYLLYARVHPANRVNGAERGAEHDLELHR